MPLLVIYTEHFNNYYQFFTTFPNNRRDGTLLNSFYEASTTLTPKPDEDIARKQQNNTDPLSLTNIDAKIIKKNSDKLNSATYEKDYIL